MRVLIFVGILLIQSFSIAATLEMNINGRGKYFLEGQNIAILCYLDENTQRVYSLNGSDRGLSLDGKMLFLKQVNNTQNYEKAISCKYIEAQVTSN